MSILFVTLLYSSGIPSLYLVATLFYFITYIVNKFLLIKFYKNTVSLTRTIPEHSIKLFKYGLLAHIICGSFMLTNPYILNLDEHFYNGEPLSQDSPSLLDTNVSNEVTLANFDNGVHSDYDEITLDQI